MQIGNLRGNMTQTTDLGEIIRLQLRKPKNWNWQLTTSKSSPHIALPAIHLYNAKGKLLLKTTDTGALKNSWSSCNLNATKKRDGGNSYSTSLPRNLQRCRSDNLESRRNATPRRQESIDRRVGFQQQPSKGRLSKSSANLLENKPAALRNVTDAANESAGCENTINAAKNSNRRLRKSRSDILDGNPYSGYRRFQESFQQNFIPLSQDQSPQTTHYNYKRSNSDALYRKSSKYRDESMKRAITDGYSNFLTSNPPESKTASNGRRNRQYTRHNTENVVVSNNAQNIDVTQLHHKKYKTRTSSAGTLIISDESFSFGRRRRQRNQNENNHKKHADVQELLDKIRSRKNKQLRQISDPTVYKQQLVSEKQNVPISARKAPENLFYSLSDVFPLTELLEGEKLPECDDNSNYIVQEPITPSSDAKSRKDSGPIVEPAAWKKKVKLQRRLSIDSTSSDAMERRHRRRGGDGNKGKMHLCSCYSY